MALAPGWYPDPDDAEARRYWDGEDWSAPLPTAAQAQAACSKTGCERPRQIASRLCADHERQRLLDERAKRMRSDDPAVRAAAVRESAEAAKTCAIAPCQEPRVTGGQFCAKHGRGTLASTAPIAPGGDSQMVCPHCGVRGRVHTRRITVKRGISGGKATGAVFTLGWSMLATGLSRKEEVTQASCGNCLASWQF